MKLRSKPWFHMYTRPTRLQDFEIIIRPAILETAEFIESEVLYVPQNGKWEGWHRSDQIDGWGRRVWKNILSPRWSLERHRRHLERIDQRIQRSISALLRSLTQPGRGNRRLVAAFRSYLRSFTPMAVYLWLPFVIERSTEAWLRTALERRYQDGAALFEVLAQASVPSRIDQLEMVLLRWKVQSGTLADLRRLANRFGFLGAYSVNDPPWTARQLRSQVQNERRPAERLRERQARFRAQRRAVALALHRLKSDQRLHRITAVVHAYTFLRNERADIYRQAMVRTQPFYRWLERRYRLPRGSAADLTIHEIIDILRGRLVISRQELAQRAKHGYVVHLTRRTSRVIADPRQRNAFLRTQIRGWGTESQRRELIGQVAFPGKVRGRARLILRAAEAARLRTGEILIANMTHPDYLVAIKRAAAIVTDEGGIVCHAAIISRELKIPAVIGTREATKVFKTGDFVEVDARKGIVRKL